MSACFIFVVNNLWVLSFSTFKDLFNLSFFTFRALISFADCLSLINCCSSCDFLNKIKNINAIPGNAILVTADAVGLYPSIPRQTGLEALERHWIKEKRIKYLRVN